MNREEVLKKLQSNPQNIYDETVRVLYKIADNIMQDPFSLKLRCLQKANSTVKNKILSASGGAECLKFMGFQETDSSFMLHDDACLEKLEVVRNLLENMKNKHEASASGAVKKPHTQETTSKSGIKPEACDSLKGIKRFILPQLVPKYANAFLRSIEVHFHSALAFADKDTQERAKKLIPVVQLEKNAQERLKSLQAEMEKEKLSEIKHSLQDMLLLELLSWFKADFFSWVNTLDCELCGSKTISSHMSENPNDLRYTNRVEMHKCEKCNHFMKFPRYNDLNILLQTRRGRCGEWAQVFTLMCCAMGWESRYVVDQLDHVWTEVFSRSQNRWLHCDSCENACDTPLMYEHGWNKKLTYVIAYSAEEVQDVTWRYSSEHKDVLRRRHNCSEDELISALIELRKQRQKHLSEERRNFLTERLIVELTELMVERKPAENENQGRISGSLEWRKTRGETKMENNFVWKIEDSQISDNSLTIKYSSAQNIYYFSYGSGVSQTVKIWNSGAFGFENIFRKEEIDWKTVYLARNEGSDYAAISWKFEMEGSKVIDKVTLKFDYKIYETGCVDVKLSSDEICDELPKGEIQLETAKFSGSRHLLISASLSGGKGDVAWQHAQLFRQLMNSEEFPFIVIFSFK